MEQMLIDDYWANYIVRQSYRPLPLQQMLGLRSMHRSFARFAGLDDFKEREWTIVVQFLDNHFNNKDNFIFSPSYGGIMNLLGEYVVLLFDEFQEDRNLLNNLENRYLNRNAYSSYLRSTRFLLSIESIKEREQKIEKQLKTIE